VRSVPASEVTHTLFAAASIPAMRSASRRRADTAHRPQGDRRAVRYPCHSRQIARAALYRLDDEPRENHSQIADEIRLIGRAHCHLGPLDDVCSVSGCGTRGCRRGGARALGESLAKQGASDVRRCLAVREDGHALAPCDMAHLPWMRRRSPAARGPSRAPPAGARSSTPGRQVGCGYGPSFPQGPHKSDGPGPGGISLSSCQGPASLTVGRPAARRRWTPSAARVGSSSLPLHLSRAYTRHLVPTWEPHPIG